MGQILLASRMLTGFEENTWLWFRLPGSTMTTISTYGFWFWASCELHGDHFY
ncbi:hypothetical protein P2R12_22785 [Cytobacillus oceanisediminis]|uniref:hypothetical protein n=1 Tax=Cytobacillus oceanisediminis TaxID=665099 RepID=UPI0023DBEC86|nr:hypothetical protein [Cytobacillus oceanisediminis]MDF2039771.1 hypothetical protein [Cytobacillus oceanisediminis]